MILINSSPKDALKIFQRFLPIFVPVGIGYLLAVTEQKGIKPRFIDEQIEEDTLGRIEGYLKRMERPYFFGFSVLTAAFKSAVSVAEKLKKLYPDSLICFGGIHPTAAPEEVLSFPFVDVVLRNESENSLIELYKCVKERKDFTHIDGLSYRRDEQIVHNEKAPFLGDLDHLPPFPYYLFESKRYDLGFVISSRGCPHGCIFCSNRVTTGKKYRIRSAGPIIDELEMLYQKYGKRHIIFLDDNLLASKERVYVLIDEIKKRGLNKAMTFKIRH